MTNDKAVEVMAMAFAASSPCQMTQAEALAATRAAIRAHHAAGGLVLREVPEDYELGRTPEGYAVAVGRNTALKEVRALAVEVGE